MEEAEDKRTRNQETLHYTHRDGVVTVTREYSHPSLRGVVTQRTYKSMDDVRLDSRQAASQLARAASILGWGADPFANGREVTVQEWRDKAVPDIPLYYWSRRVGGSTSGVILRSGAGLLRRMLAGEEWILVVLDEGGVFEWRDGGPAPTGFLGRARAVLQRGSEGASEEVPAVRGVSA